MHNQTSININPYLTFPGNCKEAMIFYKDASNGELEMLPYSESPMDLPPDHADKILHATLNFGNGVIMAADAMPGQEVTNGNSIHISIAAPNLDEAKNLFTKLSTGGTIIMPFEKVFWGATFGMFADKFGINWMINSEPEETK